MEELYKIYKYQLEEEINVENNKMRISDFKNIATLGIRLKDLDWVRHFTNEHKDKLDLRYQQSAEAYNLARIDFYKEEYSAARKKLVNVEYADIHYELGSRALLIKIYFETTDSELMLQNLNSLKLFVRRSRLISDYQKRIYLNFLKCIHKMNRLIDGDKRVTETLDHLIYEDKAIADYTWVRKKYEEIKSL
ncbi:MAG: hypothetical protein MRY83_19795 [Flavobacteriales bacterium]|nr:hypothetical protein [Flavobacteriales bacterium]